MIYSFPMNFNLIQNNGFQITQLTIADSINEDYVDKLPSDCIISSTINCSESENLEIQAGELLLVFNANQNYEVKNDSLVYYKNRIVFNSNGDVIESNYNYDEALNTSELKTLTSEEVTNKLISGFEGEFSPESIFASIAFFTFSNILMNTIYIIIASILALLLRYGLKKFLSYKEAFKLFVFSSTWPIIICVIVGMFGLYPFMPVIYQFGTPLMFLLVFYRNIGNVK
jgi:maltodextrin utilization protein YvdJ